MEKPSLLISAVGGDIGSSAVRALREEASLIVGCDMRPYPAVLPLLDSFYIAPPASETAAYMTFLKDVLERHRIEFFLPVAEPEMAVLNQRRDEIEEGEVKLLLNNRTVLDNFLDKYDATRYLSAMGLAVPETALLKDYDGHLGFPLIVKPRTGYGNKSSWIIEDENDLSYVRSKDSGLLLVQEYIGSESEEYTTGVFSDGRTVSSITFRRRLGFGSLSAEAILVDVPFLDKVAEIIARKTSLIGCLNLQSRRVKDIFVIFEINPRLSSTLLFRKKFGFDDAVWWLDTLRGTSCSFKKKFRSGRAVRFVSECYFDMEKI